MMVAQVTVNCMPQQHAHSPSEQYLDQAGIESQEYMKRYAMKPTKLETKESFKELHGVP